MQNQEPKGAAWQRRREEYLRAAGRYGDLIKEGYMSPESVERWSVIVGGRTGRLRQSGGVTRFYLVERVGSTTSQPRRTSAGMQLLSTRPWVLQRKS